MTATQFSEAVDLIMSEINRHFPIFHVLRSGYPLCGFNLALPESWPPGHRWVSHLDARVHHVTTCEDCKEILKCEQS